MFAHIRAADNGDGEAVSKNMGVNIIADQTLQGRHRFFFHGFGGAARFDKRFDIFRKINSGFDPG
jgi:hypothetical protein